MEARLANAHSPEQKDEVIYEVIRTLAHEMFHEFVDNYSSGKSSLSHFASETGGDVYENDPGERSARIYEDMVIEKLKRKTLEEQLQKIHQPR